MTLLNWNAKDVLFSKTEASWTKRCISPALLSELKNYDAHTLRLSEASHPERQE